MNEESPAAPAALESTAARGWRLPAIGAAAIVVAGLAVWLVLGLLQGQAEQAARAELAKLQVVMATEPDSDRVKMVNLSLRPIDDTIVGHVAQLSSLETLLLAESKITDAQLARISVLNHLLALELNNNPSISDAGTAALVQLKSLESLYLKNTAITDATLAHVARLGTLVNLDLSQTGVTDEGLRQLAPLANLSVLALKRTAITDAGLAHLVHFANLQKLFVFGTKVTPQGARQFQRARAGVDVDFGE